MHHSFKATMLSSALVSLTTQAALAGVPLKGVDVKLGKNPGGGCAARVTDVNGQVNLGVWPKLPEGQHYTLDFGATGKPAHIVVLGTVEGQIEGQMSADSTKFALYKDPEDMQTRKKHVANIKWNDRSSAHAVESISAKTDSPRTNDAVRLKNPGDCNLATNQPQTPQTDAANSKPKMGKVSGAITIAQGEGDAKPASTGVITFNSDGVNPIIVALDDASTPIEHPTVSNGPMPSAAVPAKAR